MVSHDAISIDCVWPWGNGVYNGTSDERQRMNQQVAILSEFKSRPTGVRAAEIDAEGHQWLTKEKGYTDVTIGDYFVLGNDGEQIMAKARFERLFYRP